MDYLKQLEILREALKNLPIEVSLDDIKFDYISSTFFKDDGNVIKGFLLFFHHGDYFLYGVFIK